MPIYEYRCRTCSHEFETMQKVSAKPLRRCPECGGRVDKLISRTSFQLKGGGWFAQDYGSSGSSSGSKASDTSSPPSGKAEGTKNASSGGDKKSG